MGPVEVDEYRGVVLRVSRQSRSLNCFTQKLRARRPLEVSGIIHPTTWRRFTAVFEFQQHCCENFISRTTVTSLVWRLVSNDESSAGASLRGTL